MTELFDIAAVSRSTGITARALRFYEARGLLRPVRTASGRRLYGIDQIERIGSIVALKAAGFSLAEIGRLLSRRTVDLGVMIEAQLAALQTRAAELDAARALLMSAKSRIDRGEPLDAATLCSLIRNGDTIMEADNWKTVADRYFTPEQQEHWADRMTALPADFDQGAYNAQWAALGAEIAARLPLDPASAEAQALLGRWQELLAPFTAVATPAMVAGAGRVYDDMAQWEGERTPPFSADVWQFIKAAAAARDG